jgi:soluble lytic murein transglycosylase
LLRRTIKRPVLIVLLLMSLGFIGLYSFNAYWTHRYDALIARQAAIYRLDPDLVWSIIYEETYFRPWRIGLDGEIGLMQVTPAVGRAWAAETGMRGLEREMERDPQALLRDPERNLQVGCWYLQRIYRDHRDLPGAEARMIAAYNAGPSRALEWGRAENGRPPSEEEFIERIDIPSTRAYVTSILSRYRQVKAARARAVAPAGSTGTRQ